MLNLKKDLLKLFHLAYVNIIGMLPHGGLYNPPKGNSFIGIKIAFFMKNNIMG